MFGISIWEGFLVLLVAVGPWVFFGGIVFALWRRMTMIAEGQSRAAEAIRRIIEALQVKTDKNRQEPNR